ncbi:response regulator [Spirosoma validum]|uniref:Response regulator n=1 Tax=Spirosoma validum TaxID=2771355 RepID=A0A927B481_9BACT|nr:response regulator [Spirosoma validum]MBD2755083.1 response regulator [Spirosoma validum]
MLHTPSQSVFIADDDEDDLYLIQLAFRENAPNCHLQFASNGRALLNLLEQTSSYPCLIILDLNMPFMNGFEVLQTLRANSAYEQIPIVVLTTSRSEEDRQQALSLGANGFISKPTSLAILSQTIHQLSIDWQLDQCL